MTNMRIKNNIFEFATKELSQDAMICWLVNWVNYPESDFYIVGKSVLDLLLGDKKQDNYFDVEVKRQYKKIDVLILFNNDNALIIEDKINSTEHSNQISRYKSNIKGEFEGYTIRTTYLKTGIFYDEDSRIRDKVDVVVTANDLLETLQQFEFVYQSEILGSFMDRLNTICSEEVKMKKYIETMQYSKVLECAIGQYVLLKDIFNDRDINKSIGKRYMKKDLNPEEYVDHIYSDFNLDGTPWTQYCFWGMRHHKQIKEENKIEYQYLFWRIDKNSGKYYIALRHYDDSTKVNDETRKRKVFYYKRLRESCKVYERDNLSLFKQIGTRENYQESDLLYIEVENIEGKMSFEELRNLLRDIKKRIYNLAEDFKFIDYE